MTARLQEKYSQEVIPSLRKQFGYTNIMQIPKVTKVTLNFGLGGEAVQNPKVIDKALEQMAAIAGQKAVVTRAKKSVSNFKLRAGMPIGVTVTLRRDRMYEFLDRLISVALPRVRDFRGISPKAFDGRGNYTLGIREQLVFPEIDYDSIDKIRGMNVTIVTSAKSDDEGRALLSAFGMPFRT